MTYEEVINKLENIDTDNCFPIYVPSHLRPGHFLYKNIISRLPEDFRKNKVHYIVRKEMYKQYKRAQPDVQIHVIPDSYVYPDMGTDTTRKFLFDLAYENNEKYIFDFDDDIDSISMCYSYGNNTRRLNSKDRNKYAFQLLTLASDVSREAFKKYLRLCLGQLSRVTPSSCKKDYHLKKIIINTGGIPRMSNILNIKRMKKHHMERTGSFDLQMEDMGIDYRVLENHGWLFTIPGILHTIPTMEVNPRTEPRVHKSYGDEKSLWNNGLQTLHEEFVLAEYVSFTSANKNYYDFQRPVGINWNTLRKKYPEYQRIEEDW